ncbi:unnamed protein product [Arctia plantaginis]|uniref:Uncharacterized protein n=1 Tax=Arctia plantaginis TaxID=874455 RepID=A0A8S0ZZZ5_ARCPL|nr:unnamed protein product [Arctia plantaginis]
MFKRLPHALSLKDENEDAQRNCYTIKQKKLRWLGHVHRIAKINFPRGNSSCQVHPKLRFKNSVKRDMISFDINFSDCEAIAKARDPW